MGKDQELLEAARNGNIPVVEKILSQRAKRSGPLASLRRGPGANVQDSSGYSALHHAALNGHKEVVQLLLAHEASTNILDDKGSSPLHLAAWTGNVDVVRLLLTHGPSVPNVNLLTRDHETALHCAAQYGHTKVVSQLLEHSCDPAIPNCRGETALDLAAQYGRLDTVERLVRTHPELIQPYSKGNIFSVMFPHTPLHLASRNGHKAVVEVLLAAGVDVNVRTSSGTALHEAALCGKTEVVRTLLEAGVDLRIRDAARKTVSEVLRQFPAHVTHEISSLIQRHRQATGGADSSDGGGEEDLPPIPNPNLGSPYENVRPSATGPMLVLRPTGPGGGVGSGGTSPTHWEPQNRNRSHTAGSAPEEHLMHRATATSVVSISSDSHHGGFLSDEPFVSRNREPDQLSVSSAASSCGGGGGGQHRRGPSYCSNASDGIYLPMSGGCGTGTPSPGSNSKTSPGMLQPTPPKKPPRRNLSVSPTHPQNPHFSLSIDSAPMPTSTSAGAYEYLFLARSGTRNADDEMQGSPGSVSSSSSRRDGLLRRGRSADQYVDMRLHAVDMESDSSSSSALLAAVASAGYENVTLRTVNPRRKLRRNHERNYDNAEPTSIAAVVAVRRPDSNADLSPLAAARDGDGEVVLTATPKPKSRFVPTPLSPTSYQQPPTPDHPPPSAATAERSIHERIRPLSQEYNNNKRRSRDIETETDDDLLVCAVWPGPEEVVLTASNKNRDRDSRTSRGSRGSLSGSLSSSLSVHSDKVLGSDTVEEYVGDAPFSGLLKGSVAQAQLEAGHRTSAERPKTLRRLKNVYEMEIVSAAKQPPPAPATTPTTVPSQPPALPSVPPPASSVTSAPSPGPEPTGNGAPPSNADKNASMLSPFDEQEEWNKISEIMASFGTGLVRESVFVSELEQEFQQRLGLSRSPSAVSAAPSTTVTSTSTEDPTSTPIVCSTVGQWLKSIGLSELEPLLREHGYDDIDFLNGVLEDQDLREIGVSGDKERNTILEAAQALPNLVKTVAQQHQVDRNSQLMNGSAESSSSTVPEENPSDAVDQWLRKIRLLDPYSETFRRHLYTDMDRVRRVWEVELTAVLEIAKVGHRRRMLASLSGGRRQLRTGSLCPEVAAAGSRVRSTSSLSLASPATNQPTLNLDEISTDLNQLKSNFQQLKDEIKDKMPANTNAANPPPKLSTPSGVSTTGPPSSQTAPEGVTSNSIHPPATGTLRHSHKKSRPAPPPPVQLPPPDLEIRDPSSLLIGVPATLTTTWRHKPDALLAGNVSYLANYLGSTVVKELRGTESTKKSIQKLKKPPGTPKSTPDVVLSISYRGVRFLKPNTEELVCEHAIKNIHCACQDADDLTHFAYITKDNLSSDHFCHVFCVLTMDQATEVIMTLGQAFEVAYQMALKEQARGTNGHTRSQSAVGPTSTPHSHARSLSDVRVNGQEREHAPPHTPPPSAMPPPTLMLTEDILGLG